VSIYSLIILKIFAKIMFILVTHMDFLVPYTKTLDSSIKQESVGKYEPPDEYSEMKAEDDQAPYDLIQEEESQNMDDEDIVYEAYEIQEQLPASASTPQNQKSQITLVRSSHSASNAQATIPQLQPLITSITGSSTPKTQSQTLQLSTNQISQIAQQQQQQQQQTQAIQAQQQTMSMPVHTEDQSNADLNFFLALLPDIKTMNNEQKRKLRIGTLKLIDEILSGTH
jgi:hypothetical protein